MWPVSCLRVSRDWYLYIVSSSRSASHQGIFRIYFCLHVTHLCIATPAQKPLHLVTVSFTASGALTLLWSVSAAAVFGGSVPSRDKQQCLWILWASNLGGNIFAWLRVSFQEHLDILQDYLKWSGILCLSWLRDSISDWFFFFSVIPTHKPKNLE